MVAKSTFGLEQESSRRTDEERPKLKLSGPEDTRTRRRTFRMLRTSSKHQRRPSRRRKGVFSELQDLHKALKGVLRVKTKLPPKKFFISLSIEGTCIVGECWV